MAKFSKRSEINVASHVVFEWYKRRGVLERLIPPWERKRIKVLEQKGGILDGGLVKIKIKRGLFRFLWVSEHFDYLEGIQFKDRQVQGPFTSWVHTHKVTPISANSSEIEDLIDYHFPLWQGIGLSALPKELHRAFLYRHEVCRQDIEFFQKWNTSSPLKIAVTGATGFIGSSLCHFLETAGHQVFKIKRNVSKLLQNEISCGFDGKITNINALEGMDAIIHLAGENIASGYWTNEKKRRIKESRIYNTNALCDSLLSLKLPPKVVVSSSAIGYYGNRGEESLHEESSAGTGFLSEVCEGWEKATSRLKDRGIRVVNLRIGIVLSPEGGVLKNMLLPFQLGLGGKIGNGEQFMSWIALDDLLSIILFCLQNPNLRGPVNAVSPKPLKNQEFTDCLAKVLKRWAIFPLPSFVAKCLFGEMADALLLSSSRVEPKQLLDHGYPFRYAHLEEALRHCLGLNP